MSTLQNTKLTRQNTNKSTLDSVKADYGENVNLRFQQLFQDSESNSPISEKSSQYSENTQNNLFEEHKFDKTSVKRSGKKSKKIDLDYEIKEKLIINNISKKNIVKKPAHSQSENFDKTKQKYDLRENWLEVYQTIKDMRKERDAVVDT